MNKWVKVGDLIISINKGVTPSYVDNSSIFVLNQKCIRKNSIDYTQIRYISDSKKISESKFIAIGDILINSTGKGTAGRVAFVNYLPNNVMGVIDSHILRVRCHNYIEAKCLSYILYSKEEYLQTLIDGSTGQGEFDKLRLMNLQTKFPIDEIIQKKIAKVLSDLDSKIELNNKINLQLEEMAKTIYDYWFVQFDFPISKEIALEMGDPSLEGKPYKSSGGKMIFNKDLNREIPQNWSVVELSDIAEITMGQSPSGTSYNENNEGIIFFQGSTDFGWRFPSIRQFTNNPKRFAKQGDILLSVRAPVGDINIANHNCCIGRGLAALRSKENYNSYLFYVMKYFKNIFDSRNKIGTTFGAITKDDLFSLKLVYPSKTELIAYDDIVKNHNTSIFNNDQQNRQLTKLRDWLLPMLMNGQVSAEDIPID